MVSSAVILWAAIVGLAEPNESPRWKEAHRSISIAVWRGTNLNFQAVQVWVEGTRPTHDARSLGNEFAERRAEVYMAASQLTVIGR